MATGIPFANGHTKRSRRKAKASNGSHNSSIDITVSYEGKQRAELTGHEDKVSGALLLPNGEGFVSWSHDGTLLKWSADGAKGPAFLGHREAVNGALLLARDRNILSWSMDGTIRVWDSGGRLLNLWFSPAGPISHVEPCEKLDHYFVSFGKYTGTVRLPVPKR